MRNMRRSDRTVTTGQSRWYAVKNDHNSLQLLILGSLAQNCRIGGYTVVLLLHAPALRGVEGLISFLSMLVSGHPLIGKPAKGRYRYDKWGKINPVGSFSVSA